jgi:putative protease
METQDLSIGDEIKILGPTTGVYEDVISEIRVDEKVTDKTIKGEFCSIPVKTQIRRSDKVYKVIDVEFED